MCLSDSNRGRTGADESVPPTRWQTGILKIQCPSTLPMHTHYRQRFFRICAGRSGRVCWKMVAVGIER
jgi:hypothetical protein